MIKYFMVRNKDGKEYCQPVQLAIGKTANDAAALMESLGLIVIKEVPSYIHERSHTSL